MKRDSSNLDVLRSVAPRLALIMKVLLGIFTALFPIFHDTTRVITEPIRQHFDYLSEKLNTRWVEDALLKEYTRPLNLDKIMTPPYYYG